MQVFVLDYTLYSVIETSHQQMSVVMLVELSLSRIYLVYNLEYTNVTWL